MAFDFTRLFVAGKIGNLEIKNRIVMAAMGNHWTTDGYVTQRHLDYYAERAKGGVGLIITEGCCVQYPEGKGWEQMSVDDEKYLSGLSMLADSIKRNGAKAIIQLHHAGAVAPLRLTGGATPVAPSFVQRYGYERNRTLTIVEIREIRNCFIKAALRSKKAGFDGVEIHGAHNYLLAQFHSPIWNERNDEYGGSLINRARLTTEIVSEIKNRIPEMPIICRFNGSEYGAEEYFGTAGLNLKDAMAIAKLVEASGVDAVHISAFGWGTERLKNYPGQPGELVPLAKAIKKVVFIPVIAVGRITPEVGEKILREGIVDFIAIGRGLLADPYLPQKIHKGKLEDITPCITCLECLGQPRMNICTVNARNGQEGTYPYPIRKAPKSKNVVIIGGGPGGMEAARIAALRGHNVTLYEKHNELGGKLLIIDKTSSKKNMGLLNPYLKRQVKNIGVKVKIGTKATAEMILREHPDAVIIATGANAIKPEIKGLEKTKMIDATELLAGNAKVGKKVVIIGGEMVGCEVADAISEKGCKDITIVRRGSEVLTKTRVIRLRDVLLQHLKERGVKFELGVTYKEANEKGLIVIDRNGKEVILLADSIILAVGAKADNKLQFELEGKVPEICTVGDAREPRQLMQAIHEGFKAAYSL